jgi:hypothetical protein
MNPRRRLLPAVLLALSSGAAPASDLDYTFIDFRVLDDALNARGTQSPIPEQPVETEAHGGNGISVAGSLALPARLYVAGHFDSSVIDVETHIVSPLAEEDVADQFDLVESSFGVGYRYPLGTRLDLVGEISYMTTQLDFGSLAGENFDTKGTGVGAGVGVRWNPRPSFEAYATGTVSPVAKVSLDERDFASGTVVNAGIRWYFFQDLGVGIDYRSGDLSTWTLSMRFGFGDLPW